MAGHSSLKQSLQDDNTKIKIDVLNEHAIDQQFWVDELIFRPVGTDLYQISGEKIWKNGWFYE